MRHARRLGALLLVSLLGSTALAVAPPRPAQPEAAPSPAYGIRLPQGLADFTARTGFFASAKGGIEALDLVNGKVLWETVEAQRPLLLDGQHLLAQAGVKRNRLRILRLDCTKQGECDLESDPVVFPAWVVTGSAPGHSFTAHWRLQRQQLLLDWEANAWYVGSRPTPEQTSAARKHAAGLAAIDLRTGQIDIRPAEKKETPPLPPLPEHLEKKSLRWQGRVGAVWKVLTLEEENGQQRFLLHSWDQHHEKKQEPKELLHGKRLVARTTLDERVLCLREASPSPDDNASLMTKKTPRYWSLFSVQTGASIGRIQHEEGMHDLAVLGSRVFYLVPGPFHAAPDRPSVQPQILKVIDLKSGKKLWERPVAGQPFASSP
jgi:hypothetical protein